MLVSEAFARTRYPTVPWDGTVAEIAPVLSVSSFVQRFDNR
jgi:hypothetical protein